MIDTDALYLYCLKHHAIMLPIALRLFPGEAVGLFFSPHWCRLGSLQGDSVDFGEASVSLDNIFEAHLFNETGELRWLRDPTGNGVGQAVYLSETSLEKITSTEFEGWQSVLPVLGKNATYDWQQLDYRDHQYLLCGKKWTTTTMPHSWSLLATARIGKLPVPLELSQRAQYVVLKVREYLGPAPGLAGRYGNIVVLEERLLKLEEFIHDEN